MDLDYSEEQQMLRETVRRLCEECAPLSIVRELEDDPAGYPEPLWRQMGELGLVGLTLPETYGGAGLSVLDAAVLYEEFGRALSPSPHFASAVMAGGVLCRGGSEQRKSEWLPRIASGEAIVTPAWLEPKGGFGPAGVRLRATASGDAYSLSGVKWHVPFAASAARLLVLARSGPRDEDIGLFLVDPKAPGVTLRQQYTIGSGTQYEVVFDNVPVAAADRIGAEGEGWTIWDEVMHDGIILLAAQAMGGARRALEITVQYAREREQFDKPLGAFQAIAHDLADACTAIDGGTTLVYEAAWARASGRSARRLAPMAKQFACQTYRDVTASCVQIHGGYGFSLDYDIQLYFRRAKEMQLSWWDARYLEELIATDVLDGDLPRRLTDDGRRPCPWPPAALESGPRSRQQLMRDLAEIAGVRGRATL